MVGTSKILTVSYGTFSCTLEGFEDPFTTMKAIAEYFRDLAANDRYFGAEPPTPDAAVLHRIAEDTVKKPVTSEVDENGVTLRQSGADSAGTDAYAAPEQVAAPEVTDTATETAIAPEVNAEPATAAVDASDDDEAEAHPVPDQTIDEIFAKDRVQAALAAGDEDIAADIAASLQAGDDEPAQTAAQSLDDTKDEPDSVAEKLKRIRAVVGRKSRAGEYSEDQHSDEFFSSEEAPQSADEIAEEADTAVASPEPTVSVATDSDEDQEELTIDARALRRQERARRQAEAEEAEDAVQQGEDEAQVEVEDDPAVRASIDAASETLEDEPADDEPAIDLLSEEPEDILAREAAEAAQNRDKTTTVGDEQAAPSTPVRVIKVRKSETAAEDTQTRPDLRRRDVEAEIGRADDSMDRIFAKTDSELEGDETRRRRDALAHLKAAVAATKAEKAAGHDLDDGSETLAEFQSDLNSLVRKKMADKTGGKTPLVLVSEQRVPEKPRDSGRHMRQFRIENGNLRPKPEAEVASADQKNEALASARSFREFADEVGAVDLTDLLEAAAVYASYVEGRPHFSRPLLIHQVAALKETEGFTREEGLRSFGELLRNGTIKKLKRGMFVVNQDSKFVPGAVARQA